ncbi:MAG TPA: hypothetical protein VFF73_24255 [Planctomycetota bacterium]|nr:hypothetical protein [Planctomycetota bacterium]
MSKKAREVDRKLAAAGVRRVKSIDELAFGTPEDADQLLAAIRDLRRRSRGARKRAR